MNRVLFGGSLVCVLFLLFGTFLFPGNMVMDLASMSVVATVGRALMAMVLLAVLFSSPPRRMEARAAMGALATILLVTGLSLSFSNSMHVLDIILYLELGCSLGIEALEFNDDELGERTEQLHDMYRQLALTDLAKHSEAFRLGLLQAASRTLR